MDSHIKAGWSRKTTTETGKPIWSCAQMCSFPPLCMFYSHRTDSTPFVTLIWKAERTEKASSYSHNNPSVQWKRNPTALFFLIVPGCIRHCHFPDTSEPLRNSFKLVSVRNMTSTLVWRWIWESHFVFVCTLINIHYSLSLVVNFYFRVKTHQKHITGKRGNRNAKKPLVKECTHKGKDAMTI